MKIDKFEDIEAWKEARLLVNEIYNYFRNIKDYGFKDQLQRAAISIMNNIAEGFDAGSDKLFIRYLHCAKASCGEVNSMLYLCEDLNYADKDKIKKKKEVPSAECRVPSAEKANYEHETKK